jgi:hypothetical protein
MVDGEHLRRENTFTGEVTDQEENQGEEEVEERRKSTKRMLARSRKAEEVGRRRNPRRRTSADEEKRRSSRRLERSHLDSLHEVVEEIVARRTVVVAWRGDAGVGGKFVGRRRPWRRNGEFALDLRSPFSIPSEEMISTARRISGVLGRGGGARTGGAMVEMPRWPEMGFLPLLFGLQMKKEKGRGRREEGGWVVAVVQGIIIEKIRERSR